MDEIIKQIRNIIGDNDFNYIIIHICYDEIWLEIYETEVPIVIDLKKKEVYMECESGHHLTGDMLDELSRIVKLLEDNLDRIEELLKWD